jgi:pilus assembly protein CpaC
MMAMSYRLAFRLALVASVALPLAIAPAWAAKIRRITMEPGDQKTWAQPNEVVRAATANEKIVGINVVSPKGVVLTAKAPGTAMVSVWEAGRSTPSVQYQVVVTFGAQNSRDALGSDQGQARTDSVGPVLRLSGDLSSLERHQSVASTLEATAKASGENNEGGGLFSMLFGGGNNNKNSVVDSSRSAFDVQVQLDVKIVEVSRSKLKSSGFYAQRYHGGATTGLSGPSNLSGFTSDPNAGSRSILSSTGFIPRADTFNIFLWGANSLTVFSALENNGFAYVLAEPSLTAISGQTANFLAGGEIPIPIRNVTSGESTIQVTWKEFGIRLGMTPTVLDNNRITIKVAPEVSEIDSSLSITAGGLSIPGLRVRRTETTVAAGDGETFIISGLVSQQTAASVDKFPFLGDIPILGAFFKSNRFDKEDKELMMIVTPHLVRPFAKETKLPALPGDEMRDYDPGYLRLLFLDTGKFAPTDSGFSR